MLHIFTLKTPLLGQKITVSVHLKQQECIDKSSVPIPPTDCRININRVRLHFMMDLQYNQITL